MTETAFTGPIVQFGVTISSSGAGLTGIDLEHNPQRAPTFADLGDAMMDPRAAYAYTPGHSVPTRGFFSNVATVDYVPTTASSNAFVSNTLSSSGVSTFTLNAASSASGTYLTTIAAPENNNAATTSLIAIDSTAAYLPFGISGALSIWNPAAGTGRNITIFPSSNGDGGSYTVAGRDMYGYKMTETIPAGGTTLAGRKAFKYVSSVTNTTTPTSTGISIGFGDVFGMPFAVTYTGLNAVVQLLPTSFSSAASVALSSATTILASTAATQTSSTPDVRGTYASTTASNSTQRLQIVVSPTPVVMATISASNVSGLFGGTQFSSV